MFTIAADNTMLSDIKLPMPGSGKRSMPPPPPPPTNKKPLKNLNLNINSKNPLLSGNTRMESDEDSWHISLLEASENGEEKEFPEEFNIPDIPGLEAFAEKIGLGSSQEWDDMKERPAPEVVTPSPPPPLFHDYVMPQNGPEEEVWGDLTMTLVSVSPMEVEGRQITEPVAETEPTVGAETIVNSNNNNQGKMNQDTVMTHEEIENIRKTENTLHMSENDFKELDVFLRDGLDSLLSANETKAATNNQTFDIVEYAVGESGVGLDEDDKLTEDEPAKATMDENYISDLKKVKVEPAEFMEFGEPVQNVSIEFIEETPRKRSRRVGRPINNNPITVTEIPQACKLPANELKALKYQRTRELNNKASRRFRLKKKEREMQSQQELEQLRAQNYLLQHTVDSMEREVALWKEKVSSIRQ